VSTKTTAEKEGQMSLHRNAKLGLAGRYALVQAIERGSPIREAARRHGVSPATACTWSRRWRAANAEERSTLACLFDRSSRPHRSARMLAASDEAARICAERRGSGHGPRVIAARLGYPHATVWKALRRSGCSRPQATPRVSRRAATNGPVRATCCTSTGRRSLASTSRGTPSPAIARARPPRSGASSAPTSYTRSSTTTPDSPTPRCCPTAKAKTVTGFCERALAFYAEHGIEAQRLMSDNAWSHVRNPSLRGLLTASGIRHLTTKPYRPRTNGKFERFIQTLERAWAYGLVYASSKHRQRALPYWLDHYNRSRPHSSLGSRPPITRVRNVCRQDS
jgi:transposase InsO family protein